MTCKRHRRGSVAGWTPVDTRDGKIWAVAESHFCARCGDTMNPRLVKGTIKRTQREALLAYGLPLADVDAFCPPPAPAEPGEGIPLSCWPFPVSTHFKHQENHRA